MLEYMLDWCAQLRNAAHDLERVKGLAEGLGVYLVHAADFYAVGDDEWPIVVFAEEWLEALTRKTRLPATATEGRVRLLAAELSVFLQEQL